MIHGPTIKRMHAWLVAPRTPLVIIAVAMVLPGCGSSTPASLSGEVRYQDVPVAEGGIRLFPLQYTKGHGAAVTIADGRYAFPLASNLAPGLYRVEIHAMQKTGRKIEDVDEFTGTSKGMIDEYKPLIPRRFNVESTLEVRLEPGHNAHDFLLTEQ